MGRSSQNGYQNRWDGKDTGDRPSMANVMHEVRECEDVLK